MRHRFLLLPSLCLAFILRRLHPPADTIQFVEGSLIETLTGDSLFRRVLALHGPEQVDWVDATGWPSVLGSPHDYRVAS